MFTRVYPVIIVVLLVGLLFGCGSKDVAPVDTDSLKNKLVGKVWKCEAMFKRDIVGDTPLTLEFTATGSVSGSSGCNTFTGTYTLTRNALKFGPFSLTKKTCIGALGEQEHSYLYSLSLVNEVKVDGNEIEMFAEEQSHSIKFTSASNGFFW